MKKTGENQADIKIVKVKRVKSAKCVRCGFPISPYCFTMVKDLRGKSLYPRCQNCGHWDDPE